METDMHGRLVRLLVILALGAPRVATAQEAQPPALPAIPGITADDHFPAACVSCHVPLPDGLDARLSALMAQWQVKVDSVLLAKAQAAAPAGLRLEGRHPAASESLQSIPLGCLACHGRNATQAPPFARLMHRIHLAGAEENHFLTMFGGECTYCHKLDPESGAWSIPSVPEPGT